MKQGKSRVEPGMIATASCVVLASAAVTPAALVIDVRPTNGDRTVAINDPLITSVTFDVWAKVTGGTNSNDNEGFQSAYGSFLSANIGGATALGSLSSALASPFNGTSSQSGTQADLDSDTDLDVGSNTNSSATGFFFARANAMVNAANLSGATSNLITNGREFRIGTVTYTKNSVGAFSKTNRTEINWRGRTDGSLFVASNWQEDGVSVASATNSITPADLATVLYHGWAEADAGLDITLNTGENLVLAGLGSASTYSSVSNYEWDINGDDVYDFVGASLNLTPLQYSSLISGNNVYTTKLRVTSADGFSAVDSLQLTYAVPEPASLGLLGLASLAMGRRRRG